MASVGVGGANVDKMQTADVDVDDTGASVVTYLAVLALGHFESCWQMDANETISCDRSRARCSSRDCNIVIVPVNRLCTVRLAKPILELG